MNGRGRLIVLLALVSAPVTFADIVTTVDFEGLQDGTSVTNQYLGFLFSNATVLSSAASLNAAEFPPHSGINVVFDDGGPLSIIFGPDVLTFQAFFTYAEPLTATAFDALGNQVDTTTSLFGSNLAFSSTNPPNESLALSSLGGIHEVTLAADPNGGSFVMDDVTITTPDQTALPEPSLIVLLAGLLALVFLSRIRRTVSAAPFSRRLG